LRLKSAFPAARFVMQAHGTSWDEVRSKWRGGGLRGKITSLRNLAWLPKDMRAYRRFDQVVAVGDAVMASFARPPLSAVLPPSRRRLIQNGIDTEIFAPDPQARAILRARHHVPGAARVIVSVSRLHPQKGGAEALRAFARHAAEAARDGAETVYWIIGEGPERGRLQALAQELGVAALVRFLGHQDRRELAGYLRAADIFLFLGSRIEVGLPLNVLEALACGLPVVLAAHLISECWPGLFPATADDPERACAQLGAAAAAFAGAERRSLLPAAFELRHCLRAYLDLLAPTGSWAGS
jgi:glycosyltransferase involved in cell wall biosynthesis